MPGKGELIALFGRFEDLYGLAPPGGFGQKKRMIQLEIVTPQPKAVVERGVAYLDQERVASGAERDGNDVVQSMMMRVRLVRVEDELAIPPDRARPPMLMHKRAVRSAAE